MSEIIATHLFSAQVTLGEGPIWDSRYRVYWWIDIIDKKLFRFNPSTRVNDEWQLDQMPGTVVSRARGGLMLSVEHGFAEFDPATGTLHVVADPEADLTENRFNDGKCDPAGRFWAGTMRHDDHMQQFTGSLYALESNGEVTKHWGDVGVANGIAWSKDATRMYFVDSPRSSIFGFDYDRETGRIQNRSCVFQAPVEMGFPDGMTIDADDKLWVAFWGGWCVAQICPLTSEVMAKVSVPTANVTACAFGGPQLDQLLITTASVGLPDEARQQQPLAGDLFVAIPGVKGLPSFEYAG